MMLVDIAETLVGAIMTTTTSLQNSVTGNRVQGSIVFKQFTSNYIESLYQDAMHDIGGCASISANKTKKFPRGKPKNCTRRIKLPTGTIVKGEEIVVWLM